MNDFALTAWGLSCASPVDRVKHRGTWAVVERHKLADEAITATGDTVLGQSPLFDVRVSNHLVWMLRQRRVRVQTAVQKNSGDIADRSYVHNRNAGGIKGHVVLFSRR